MVVVVVVAVVEVVVLAGFTLCGRTFSLFFSPSLALSLGLSFSVCCACLYALGAPLPDPRLNRLIILITLIAVMGVVV